MVETSRIQDGFLFSLREILLVMMVVCITFGVCRSHLAIGAAVGATSLGALTVFAGNRLKRYNAILIGTLLVVSALA